MNLKYLQDTKPYNCGQDMPTETRDVMKSYGKRNYSQKTADASEHLLVWCLTKKQVYAQKVTMTGYDIIAFDPYGKVFDKHATALISVKAVGGNICGRRIRIEDMEKIADEMWLHSRWLYLAVGFFNKTDIRDIVFYLIPLKEAKKYVKTKKNAETGKTSEVFRISKDGAEKLADERKAIKI